MPTSGSLGSLVVSLAVDTARFQGDLGKAAAIAERRMRNIKETAARALGALTLAATAAGGALTAALASALRRADDMRETAAAIGTTTESLSGLVYAAGRAGVSQEELVTAMRKLASTAVDAATNVKGPAAAAFRVLGISVTDANGKIKDSNQLVLEIAEAYSKAPDSITKTANATDLFGRAGSKLIPFLDEGAKGIEKLTDRAAKLGLVISDETAAAADEFLDNLADLKAAATGFGNLLAADLAPSLANLSAEFTRSAGAMSALQESAEFFGNFIRVIVSGVLIVNQVLSELGKSIGGLAAAFAAAAHGDFRRAWDILGQLSEDGAKEQEKLITQLLDVWDKTAQQTGANAPKLGEQIAAPAKEAAKLTKQAAEELERYMNQAITMRNDAAAAFNSIAPDISENDATLRGVFSEIHDEAFPVDRGIKFAEVLKDDKDKADDLWSTLADQSARNAFDAISGAIANAGGSMRDFAQTTLDAFKRIISDAITRQLFELLAGLGGGGTQGGFLGAIGGFFSGLVNAPGRAAGGPVSAGRPYLVGEHGPELFMPGTSGSISPNGAGAAVYSQTNYINVDSRSDRGAVLQDIESVVRQSNRQMIEFFQDRQSRGAFGRG